LGKKCLGSTKFIGLRNGAFGWTTHPGTRGGWEKKKQRWRTKWGGVKKGGRKQKKKNDLKKSLTTPNKTGGGEKRGCTRYT